MPKLPKRLASVGVLAAAMGIAGSANAGALAQSVLQISNLLFMSGSHAGPLLETDFQSLVARDTTDGLAVLNGTPAVGGGSVNAFPFVLDMPQVCVGACTNPQNDYSHRPNGYFPDTSRVDTQLSGDPITFNGAGHPGTPATGANANAVGEVDLQNAGDGTAQGNLALQADFVFALNQTQAVTFNFNADSYLIAALGPLAAIGSAANASDSWTLTIDRDNGVGVPTTRIFTFAPNGVVDATGGELLDPCTLNDSVSTLIPNTSVVHTCVGAFSAITPVLQAGQLYHFSIRHTVSDDATKVLAAPEPESLALLGIGLLGMFAMRKRSKA